MAEKGIRGGICHAIHRYARANNKYNCLQTVLNGKNTIRFNEDFMKKYYEDSDKGYIFEVDAEYPKHLHNLHSDLPFLQERMKINK